MSPHSVPRYIQPRPLEVEQMMVGCILWIKPDVESAVVQSTGLERQRLNHPCVIVSLEPLCRGCILVCTITSLAGKDISHSKVPEPRRKDYMPIFPKTANHAPRIQLRLRNNVNLRKACYVDTGVVFQLPLSILVPYDKEMSSNHFQLDDRSIRLLLGMVALPARTQPETSAISPLPNTEETPLIGPDECFFEIPYPSSFTRTRAMSPGFVPFLGRRNRLSSFLEAHDLNGAAENLLHHTDGARSRALLDGRTTGYNPPTPVARRSWIWTSSYGVLGTFLSLLLLAGCAWIIYAIYWQIVEIRP